MFNVRIYLMNNFIKKYLIKFSLETFLLKSHNRRVEGWLSHDAEGAKDFSISEIMKKEWLSLGEKNLPN